VVSGKPWLGERIELPPHVSWVVVHLQQVWAGTPPRAFLRGQTDLGPTVTAGRQQRPGFDGTQVWG